ncbi:MAG: neprosin family prolyl endopeptidase [Alphaproteobacteria bacterium]|nr:neprosin family prolyl endopeptidase [Alphaproteobacteria bacterium]
MTGRALSLLLLLTLTACDAEPLDADLAGAEPATDHVVRVVDEVERARMEGFLADRLRPQDIVATAVLAGGDAVDCVAIEQQPTLRHLGAAAGPLRTHPADIPEGFVPSFDGGEDLVPVVEQEAVCPAGSVPFLHRTMDVLERFETLEDFHGKVPAHLGGRDAATDRFEAPTAAPRLGATSSHQYAYAYKWVTNHGIDAVFNVWTPNVERGSEFSLSQLWVTRGFGNDLETVEVGWQVYRDLYGDWDPHLFLYFTPDNYGPGGCYNTDCNGWVQTSPTATPGMRLTQSSAAGGNQVAVRIAWYQDTNRDWWLYYESGWIGYYPRALFDARGIRDVSSLVEIGGEIIDGNAVRHTQTDMGSGALPGAGFGQAAYNRNIHYVSSTRQLRDANGLGADRTDAYCYDVDLSHDASWGYHMYFGGPGYGPNCQ